MSAHAYLTGIAHRVLDATDRIRLHYNQFMGVPKSCPIQCIDDEGTISIRMVTFQRQSLGAFYALNNETNYDWDHIHTRLEKYDSIGKDIICDDGAYAVASYEDPIFGKKAAFKKIF